MKVAGLSSNTGTKEMEEAEQYWILDVQKSLHLNINLRIGGGNLISLLNLLYTTAVNSPEDGKIFQIICFILSYVFCATVI